VSFQQRQENKRRQWCFGKGKRVREDNGVLEEVEWCFGRSRNVMHERKQLLLLPQ